MKIENLRYKIYAAIKHFKNNVSFISLMVTGFYKQSEVMPLPAITRKKI